MTEREVEAVLPLYRRTVMAWSTRGVAETFDSERVEALVTVLRDAARSRGKKLRLDPLMGLRVLRSAPLGLTVMEWAASIGVSDKTIRDAWLVPLFLRHDLVERTSTRYRITPLGRAVLTASEDRLPDGGNGAGSPPDGQDVDAEPIEVEPVPAMAGNGTSRIPGQSAQRQKANGSQELGEIPEIAELLGRPE